MILIADLHKRFDLIIDKTASPYFDSIDKDDFINGGILNYVSKFFNPISGTHLAERRDVDDELISELIEPAEVSTTAKGEATIISINAALPPNRELLYILNAAKAGTNDCKDILRSSRFVRHNEFFKQSDNSFKKPSDKYPVHRYMNGRIKFDPEGVSKAAFTVVMKPVKVTLDDAGNTGVPGPNAVNCELSEKCMNEIVYLSLRQAGISMRETDFYQMVGAEEKANE